MNGGVAKELSTYVISDIHGCYEDLLRMLDKIGFSDADQLIMAGDYIDQGKQSYEMFRWTEHCPENLSRWSQLIRNMLFYHKQKKLGSRTCIVVHAGYAEKLEEIDTIYSSLEKFYLYARGEA